MGFYVGYLWITERYMVDILGYLRDIWGTYLDLWEISGGHLGISGTDLQNTGSTGSKEPNFFNRPRVAGAVLQTPFLLINSFSH